MTINPKYGMWISIIAAVISTLVLCGAEFTTIFGVADTAKILAGLGILNAMINGVNAVLHMIPSQPGPVGANEFPLGPAKIVVLFAILFIGTLIVPTPSYAQLKRPAITGNPIKDIQTDAQNLNGAKTTTATSQNAGDILNQLRAKFSADLTGDLTSALALANQEPAGCTPPATPPAGVICAAADTTAIPCYQALISLNGVINSYTPPTDKPHVISDLEQLRIVARTIQSTNFKDACAPLVQDIQAQANQLVASVLGIVSGAAKIGLVLP